MHVCIVILEWRRACQVLPVCWPTAVKVSPAWHDLRLRIGHEATPDSSCISCRIHKEELQEPRQYAVIVFMLVGAILAATIVHNNVMAFSHARHLKPAANLWMSGTDSTHLAHYRRLMLV